MSHNEQLNVGSNFITKRPWVLEETDKDQNYSFQHTNARKREYM